MGLVDFAIDMAAVLGASRSVAAKHVALRGRQLDRYGRSSSVAAAVVAAASKARARTGGGAQANPTATVTGAAAAAAPRSPGAPQDDVRQDAVPKFDAEMAAAAGGERARGSSAFSPSVSSKFTDAAKMRHPDYMGRNEITNAPTPAPSVLRDLRLQLEKKASADHSENPRHSDRIKDQGSTEEEVISEGVDLGAIFRTSRGNRLSPLWTDEKNSRNEKTQAPETVDLEGLFRTSRGSSLLKEPKAKSGAEKDDAGTGSLAEMRRSTQVTPIKKVEQGAPTPKVDHLSPEYESHRETAEIEVARYPDPSVEDSSGKPAPSQVETKTETPVSKEDAVELGELLGAAATPKYELRESKVPSSRLGRIWSYSGLAAGMLTGVVSEFSSRAVGRGSEGSLMFSPANMERLVAKLSTMRGAALKLGQMMSFQDEKMLPAPIQKVLQRVQDRADYMPAWQRDRVLVTNLGAEWRDLFEEFEEKPIAAASIGQVHRAVLKSNGAKVAVKIQYPGVADSINSDLNNLRMLLAASKLLPKGLYLDKTIANARTELGWECDYEREAACAARYKALLASESAVYSVPRVFPEASGKQVLTMEFMAGSAVTRIAPSLTQAQRDWIGTQVLRLCLREITEFRFMQTDPNWTNFLYDADGADRLVLLDFGASREYPERFILLYVRLLAAAARTDRVAVKALSEELGYLTGHESRAMLGAHVTSILTLAEPFLESAPEVYDFRDQTITERVKAQIPVMIRERLAPPPEETYSLHRKLSGAFLLCAKLGSRVRCRDMFDSAVVKSGVLEKEV